MSVPIALLVVLAAVVSLVILLAWTALQARGDGPVCQARRRPQ